MAVSCPYCSIEDHEYCVHEKTLLLLIVLVVVSAWIAQFLW